MTPSVTPDLDTSTASDSNGRSTISNDDAQDLELLDKQAEAHFMKAQFDLAFQNTERMLELAPASALGYLRMGDLYSQQGRQRAAIGVYRRGLECVSRNDPRRSELEKRRKLASDQKRKRVDFFHVLTDDIIFGILTYLTIRTRSICAEVSTVWRGRIVSYSELWRVLNYSELNMPIKSYDDLSTCLKYLGYMKAGLFENLQSLTVSGTVKWAVSRRDKFAKPDGLTRRAGFAF
ncbi:hypothetical protein BJV82DRAFT_271951 [Fennellomyces sp. T-0311]|nr:hypothetical protein BJV82DRAFT_271951 [Fennellomyces sp. T-0311]